MFDLSESLVAFKLSCCDRPGWEHGFCLSQLQMFGCNPQSYKVQASKKSRESVPVVLAVADHDFAQFSSIPPICMILISFP